MSAKIVYYTLSEIRNELIKMYGLKNDEFFKNTFDKKLKSICQKIHNSQDGKSLWERSTIRKEGAKKNSHAFTEHDKKLIANSSELKEYLSNKCTKENLSQELKDELEAEKQNEIYRDYLNSGELEELYEHLQNEPITEFVPKEEFEQTLRDIMLEALFLKFFTPINKDLLKSDMEIDRIVHPGDDDKESIQARRRLTDFKNYYKEKPDSEQLKKEVNRSVFKTPKNMN